ncbi:MAG: DUF3551 domain-containing protein [Rhodospirillaceae bacterium]|nr:DUF3551 domain-containing protein [Rhodospirillaceae bacterium]MBT5523687.1 DUF3551 domain-containing protein [Rhodospirillaceae bacterium]MBT5879737.1 DUF3551 domain-containing protein [Rhodospirillaceae bacterium]MBT6984227.1 DUF3551 domain-containing protein [Rhodospirillaceae bacterium]
MCKWPMLFAVILSLMVPAALKAAPFCAVTSAGTQCYYFSMNACRQAVSAIGGACIINQQEVKPPSGNAPFCVVASYGTQCFYYNVQACRQAAQSSGGVCAVNSNR